MFTAVLLTIAGEWNQIRCPSTEEWMMKIWDVSTTEFYSGVKKNEIVKFSRKWMEVKSIN